MAILKSQQNEEITQNIPIMEVPLVNVAKKWSLYYGICVTIYVIAFSFFSNGSDNSDPTAKYFGLLIILLGIIVIGLGGLSIRDLKSRQGGFISFSKAFGVCMLTFSIGLVLSTLFNYVFFNFINFSYVDQIRDGIIATEKARGAPQEVIDLAVAKLDQNYAFFPMLQKMGVSLLVNAFIAAILALFMKKKQKK